MEVPACNQARKFAVGGTGSGIKSSKDGSVNGDALECKNGKSPLSDQLAISITEANSLTAKIFFTESLCKRHLAEAHLSAQQDGVAIPPSMRPANAMNEYIANSPHADFRIVEERAQQYIQRARTQYNRARGFEDDEDFGADKLPPGRMR